MLLFNDSVSVSFEIVVSLLDSSNDSMAGSAGDDDDDGTGTTVAPCWALGKAPIAFKVESGANTLGGSVEDLLVPNDDDDDDDDDTCCRRGGATVSGGRVSD